MPNGCRKLHVLCFVLAMYSGPSLSVAATGKLSDSPSEVAGPEQAQPKSLIDAWLSFPDLDRVVWPYSYIRIPKQVGQELEFRRDLDKELALLNSRLQVSRGYKVLESAVSGWRDRLRGIVGTRVPGDWSPASLMTHAYRRPPVGEVSAIGACAVPAWVEVWDSHGVKRIPWTGGLQLSDLLSETNAISGGADGRVAIVNPLGEIAHRGIQAWNFSDASLAPGSRVIATLPLHGDAFPWIRDAIARVLAHAPPGDECRESPGVAVDDSNE